MNSNLGVYRFTLGDFDCACLSDGSRDYPLKDFFTNVSVEEVETALREQNLPAGYITTPCTHLFVDTGEHRLLVDMGAGHLGPRTGRLLPNIRAAGINPLEIDTIVITHAHPDNVGGALDDSGKLNFPNAAYFISKVEWDFWFSERAAIHPGGWMPEFARKKLKPLKGKTVLVEREGEILPGVSVLFSPGHTPGHMAVSFTSQYEQLLFTGDVALHPIHLAHPDWLAVFDIIPDMAIDSRQRIFDLAAETRCWVIGQQFPPFPSLGHVIKKAIGWVWNPIEK